MNMLVAFISSSIPLAIPLLYGSTGEIITEKSGHLNLGIPGIMYVGAIGGVIGSFLYENACAAASVALNPLLAVLIPPCADHLRYRHRQFLRWQPHQAGG